MITTISTLSAKIEGMITIINTTMLILYRFIDIEISIRIYTVNVAFGVSTVYM